MPSTNEAIARLEKELLARLGLGTGASNGQIESAHEEIAAYLDKAPGVLRGWAARQAGPIDEAYALLSGDRAELVAAAEAAAAEAALIAPVMPAPAPTPAGRPGPAHAAAAPAADGLVLPSGGRHTMDALDDAGEKWYDESELTAPPRRTPAERRAAQVAATTGAAPATGLNPMLKRVGLAVAAIVVVAVVGVGGYNLGAPKATPAPSTDAAAAAFETEVTALMQKLSASPNDIPTLMGLANAYYAIQDYPTSTTWIKKVLAVDPKNIDGLLALGAVSFNHSDYPTAEASWTQVLGIDPANLEAYYDLGFLYYSDNPPNIAKVKEMWGKLVAISPDSQLAQTVASHLTSLDASAPPAAGSPAPSAAGSASAAPKASASAAASPAPGTPAPSPSK